MRTATPDELKAIYTSEKIRNSIAYAHGCLDSNHVFKHFRAMNYPNDFTVSTEQIEEAKKEKERAKKVLISELGNKLVFVGMGMNYEARYEGDPCNHRIRTEFVNSKGFHFFIEFGTGLNEGEMRIDHALRRIEGGDDLRMRIERLRCNELPKYSKKGIINLINKEFDCNFTEMVVDYYNLNTDDYKSISPKS